MRIHAWVMVASRPCCRLPGRSWTTSCAPTAPRATRSRRPPSGVPTPQPFARVAGDVLGNSFARVGPETGPPVLLLGHLDEIGLIVTHVEQEDADYDGLLRVRALGGWDPQVLVGQHVTVRTRTGERPRRDRQGPEAPDDRHRDGTRLDDRGPVGRRRRRRRRGRLRDGRDRRPARGRPAAGRAGQRPASPRRRSTTAPARGWCSRRRGARPRPARCRCRWWPARRPWRRR